MQNMTKFHRIKDIQELNLEELKQIQGGCRIWRWLKKHFKPTTEMVRDIEGNEIGRVYGGKFTF